MSRQQSTYTRTWMMHPRKNGSQLQCKARCKGQEAGMCMHLHVVDERLLGARRGRERLHQLLVRLDLLLDGALDLLRVLAAQRDDPDQRVPQDLRRGRTVEKWHSRRQTDRAPASAAM